MGNCASKRRPKSRQRRRTKNTKQSQKSPIKGEVTPGVEGVEAKEEKVISTPTTPKEAGWPLEKNNIFSPNSTEKKSGGSKSKRTPIRNPKLYNEDIPINPAKGANLKSWWNDSGEFPLVEHEVTKSVGLNDTNTSINDREFKRNDNFSPSRSRAYDVMNVIDEFKIHSNRSRHNKPRNNVNDRRSNGRNGIYNDDYTTKSTSPKAHSIIASIHEFDYQPDFLKSKIVAKKNLPSQYDEEPRFGTRTIPNRHNFNNNINDDESHENHHYYSRKPKVYSPGQSNSSGTKTSCDDDGILYETHYHNENSNEYVAESLRPNYNRPSPLVRGQRGMNRTDPNFQVLNVQKELKKITTIDENSWKELIKCQSEISKQAKGNVSVLLRCDQKLLLEATRTIIVNSNSGRSNICKNSLLCVGDLFYSLPNELTTLVNDAISTVIKKASQGSSDFIRLEANKTLAKICLTSAETKLLSYLVGLYKYQQSSRPTILNCIIILFYRLDSEIVNLRQLHEVAEIAFTALSDGSQVVRNSANVLANIIQEHCDTKLLLNKLHLKAEIRSLVERSISKYDSSKREKFIQKITLIN